jgi:hypothetical protein
MNAGPCPVVGAGAIEGAGDFEDRRIARDVLSNFAAHNTRLAANGRQGISWQLKGNGETFLDTLSAVALEAEFEARCLAVGNVEVSVCRGDRHVRCVGGHVNGNARQGPRVVLDLRGVGTWRGDAECKIANARGCWRKRAVPRPSIIPLGKARRACSDQPLRS